MPRFVVTTAGALAVFAAATSVTASLHAQERNLTLSGDGYFEAGRRGERRDVREVRMTLRPNGDFAATVYTNRGNYVVRGGWRSQGMGNVDRIEIREAFGARARGDGTLAYGDRGLTARRLSLSGEGQGGEWRLEVRDRDAGDDDVPDRPGPGDIGNGSQVFRNIDARAQGSGRTSMRGINGGAFSISRARIGTGGDVVVDIAEPTSGQLRGRVQRVSGRRVEVRVTAIYGYSANGNLTVTLRDEREIARLDGEGAGERGRWTIDFRGDGLPGGSGGPGGGSGGGGDWGSEGATLNGTERGIGSVDQSAGPTIAITRARVLLQNDRDARITLESRRETIQIIGRWSPGPLGRTYFDVSRINDRSADGRLTIRRDGRSFTSFDGEGRTTGGRFSVQFDVR